MIYENLAQSLINNNITMVSNHCFNTVIRLKPNIDSIDGDIVECGVWKGGFSIFLSHIFNNRNIWVCDSYEGFQDPGTAKYNNYVNERHNSSVSIAISLEEVKLNFIKYELGNQDRITFLKGFVKDSLPNSGIKKIALLRIDVDAYSATLETLDELYDKVQSGGYIIFDDSCLYETRDAIIKFFKDRNLDNYILHPITDEKLFLDQRYTDDDSGFPQGCYYIKP